MSGGSIQAQSILVGRDGIHAGTFLQSGGSLGVGSASLNGLVNISGGTFQVGFTTVPAGSLTNNSVIRQTGGAMLFGAAAYGIAVVALLWLPETVNKELE